MARQAVVDIALRGISKAARLRNSTLSISTIPPDILGIVFLALPVVWRVTASHVCHRWRGICLDTAPLWAEIDTADGPVAMALEFLDRSKSVLLRVEARHGALDKNPALVSALCDNMDRVTFFAVYGQPEVLSSLLCQPAARLEVLRIRGSRHGRLRDGTFSEDRCWNALRLLSVQGIGIFEYVQDTRACVALMVS